jgi:thymidylate kinase
MIINIRGTNGSGKTTLARELITPQAQPVDLVWYDNPTKRDPGRRSSVEGWGTPGGYLAVGKYSTGCGGMDTIKTFDLQQQAVMAATRLPGSPRHVICEGVLASTVAGSWLEFFKAVQSEGAHRVLVAYLDTPLELCLERIRERQRATDRGEREIKEDLVADKIKSIKATRSKMEFAGIPTVLLRHDRAVEDLWDTIDEMEGA